MLACLLDRISPSHTWKKRMRVLMDQHPPHALAMGFPADWQTRALWRI